MSGGLRRRFALMLGGEAVQSAFHFGLNLVLVHTLSYGAPRVLLEVQGEYRFLALASALAAIVGALTASVLLVVLTPACSVLGLLLSETIVLVACPGFVGRRSTRRHRAAHLACRAGAA